jgi:hypothetical protein
MLLTCARHRRFAVGTHFNKGMKFQVLHLLVKDTESHFEVVNIILYKHTLTLSFFIALNNQSLFLQVGPSKITRRRKLSFLLLCV